MYKGMEAGGRIQGETFMIHRNADTTVPERALENEESSKKLKHK